MNVHEMVAHWEAMQKAAPTKTKREGDEVSADERAARLAEYNANAPSDDALDELEQRAMRGEYRVIHAGRGVYKTIKPGMC